MESAILKHLSQFKATTEEYEVIDSLIPHFDEIILASMHLKTGPLKTALNLAASLILDRIAEKAAEQHTQYSKRGEN